MSLTTEPERFFTARHAAYARFIRWMRYSPGLRSFFLAAPLLRDGMRILDAGCGTGALTFAVRGALSRRKLSARLDAFDLTPAMLEHFGATMQRRGIDDVHLAQADVLALEQLLRDWTGYDLIVSAAMLEYVPRERIADALRGLRQRLKPDGHMVLFMTRRNLLTRPLIGLWWASNLYSKRELRDAFQAAEFSAIHFRRFPLGGLHLALWGHIVEARR